MPIVPMGGEDDSESYLDDVQQILNPWGFNDSLCRLCGRSNSEIDGMLMQCGKCKKAYYCSMKCFNSDLKSHQRFCVTEQIHVEPKGASPSGGSKEKVPILPRKAKQEVSPVSSRKGVGSSKKVTPTPPAKDIDDSSSSQSESSESTAEEPAGKEQQSCVTETEISLHEEDGQGEMRSVLEITSMADCLSMCENEDANLDNHDLVPDEEIPEEIKAQMRLRGRPGHVFTREEFDREVVKLRQCQIEKREYKWEIPDWVQNPPLRQTTRGSMLKEKGILDVHEDVDGFLYNSFRDSNDGNEIVPESEIPEEILDQLRQKGYKGYKFTREEFNREMVKLRQCRIEKREYTWTIPEWILNSPLRRTDRGDVILSSGCLAKPITNVSILVTTGEIGWEKPDWATKQILRTTKAGEELKSGNRKTLHRTRSKIQEALESGELSVMKKPEWVENNPLRRSSRALVQDKF